MGIIIDMIVRYRRLILKFIKSQCKGMGIMLLLALFCFFNWFLPLHVKYTNLGSKLGTYTIRKGDVIEIWKDNLIIKFNEGVRAGVDGDSVKVYPSFLFRCLKDARSRFPESQHRYEEGRRIMIECEPYSFVIELQKIEYRGADTAAVFNVWRRNLPNADTGGIP